MIPLPWSPSGLAQFVNCPRQYHEVRVVKTVVDVPGEAAQWGTTVHKHFEDRQAVGKPLPETLSHHEAYMSKLASWEGVSFTEQKVGLDRKAMPCSFFDREVWMRQVIDFKNIDGDTARIVDYKTGKPHDKFDQLMLNAIHTFAMHPVDIVDARYYWTSTYSETRKVWSRSEIPMMWAKFIPNLKQYREAFATNVWQPRPSGLCNGWCPVKGCEHWKPKR